MLRGNHRLLAGCLLVVLSIGTATGCHHGSARPVALPALPTAGDSGSLPGTPPPGETSRTPQPPAQPPRAAAIATVRHYYQVFNALHRTMAAGALAAMFTQDCPCRAQVRAVRSAARRGEHYVDHATVNVMRASVQDRRHAFVLVNLDTGRGGLVRAAGRVVTSAPPRRGVQRVFRLVQVGGRWLIARIEAG